MCSSTAIILQLANTQRDQLTQVGLFSQICLQDLISLLIHAQPSTGEVIVFHFLGINNRSSYLPPDLSGTIDLNRLHTLKVTCGNQRGRISTLFNHTTYLFLRDFSIHSSNNQVLCGSDSFRCFLSRSGCELQELSLVGFFGMGELYIDENRLAQYLGASGLQSLKSLKFLVPSISTSILHLLLKLNRGSITFSQTWNG